MLDGCFFINFSQHSRCQSWYIASSAHTTAGRQWQTLQQWFLSWPFTTPSQGCSGSIWCPPAFFQVPKQEEVQRRQIPNREGRGEPGRIGQSASLRWWLKDQSIIPWKTTPRTPSPTCWSSAASWSFPGHWWCRWWWWKPPWAWCDHRWGPCYNWMLAASVWSGWLGHLLGQAGSS